MIRKPILSLDFDGVLHSYTSGWKGAGKIPDPPVGGAMRWLLQAMEVFDVRIFSSRNHQWGGRRAMKKWLSTWLMREMWDLPKKTQIPWVKEFIDQELDLFGAPLEWEYRRLGRLLVKRLRFPLFKPPAMVTLDDRAMTFEGPLNWPKVEELLCFQPWPKHPLYNGELQKLRKEA